MLCKFIQNTQIFLKNMDTVFDLETEINIKPIYWRSIPIINYGIDNKLIQTLSLTTSTKIYINEQLSLDNHFIWLEFVNKDYNDCQLDKNLDMAVQIESVTIEGMTLDRLKWAGNYYPEYPADYPNKKTVIESATYLGWNGKWVLPFSIPIFSWIHKLENLGWLYEP